MVVGKIYGATAVTAAINDGGPAREITEEVKSEIQESSAYVVKFSPEALEAAKKQMADEGEE